MRVARLAFAYRQQFHKDVVIDMVCYRRHGHNEGDDPSYTQPLMYKRIDARRSVRKLYTEALVRRGDITSKRPRPPSTTSSASCRRRSTRHPDARARRRAPAPGRRHPPAGVLPHVDTGVDRRRDRHGLRRPCRRCPRASPSTPSWPGSSRPGPSMFARRRGRLGPRRGPGLRLAAATKARRCGSPGRTARRGTFSHRHGVLVDYETGDEYTPARRPWPPTGTQLLDLRLAAVGVRRPRLRVRLLGRQQGRPGHLGGPVRRLRQRRPDHHRPVHRGRRGQVGPDLGPGHAAAPRLRGPGPRALLGPHRALPDRWPPRTTSRSCNATTAAQYFHLLRRQMRRSVRKPLIVFTPKSLLRAKALALAGRASSTTGSFEEVLDDPGVGRSRPR